MNEILIPRNTLIVLCGPAGSGKSTWAARHFSRTQIVSSDECRAIVVDDQSNQSVSVDAFDLVHFIIEKRLKLGRLTVADATNLTPEHRRSFIRIAKRFHFNTAAVVFNVPLATCLARNETRDRRVPKEALWIQYELFERSLSSLQHERFDSVLILDEAGQQDAQLRLVRRSVRHVRALAGESVSRNRR